MARIKPKELKRLRSVVNNSFADLGEYVETYGIDMREIDTAIETLLSNSSQLKKPELDSMAEAIGKVAHGVFEHYSHENPRTYGSVFASLLSAARLVQQKERTGYLDQVVSAMKRDAELTHMGPTYQLVPRFSEEVLTPLTIDGTGRMVSHALNYLKAVNVEGRNTAETLIKYGDIFPAMGVLNVETIDRYVNHHGPEAAARIRDDFRVARVGNISPSGTRTVVTSELWGRERDHTIHYGSGSFSQPIVDVLTELKGQL